MRIRNRILAALLAGVLAMGTSVSVMATEIVPVESTEENQSTGEETVPVESTEENQSTGEEIVPVQSTEENQNAGEETTSAENETGVVPESAASYSAYSVDAASETGLTKLPAPTNLSWGSNWNIQWECVPEAKGHYVLEVYKDGTVIDTMNWSLPMDYTGIFEANYSPHINESGAYKFRVMASNDYDPATLESSEFSAFSEERYYQRPDAVLGTTVGYWDAEQKGIFHYTTVEGAGGYLLKLYEVFEDGSQLNTYSTWSVSDGRSDVAGQVKDVDFTNRITDEGEYCVSVTALSGNLDLIANDPEGEKSNKFDTKESASTVSSVLDAALALENASAALAAVKEQINLSTLRTAMQTDDSVLAKMKTLEDSYASEKGISVAANATGGAEQYVDAGLISMVGAALNAESGAVNLAVTIPEKKIDVDTNRYANSVQLDLKLWNENQSKSQLEVPITITMPIPVGVDANHLTILHYHQDGSSEKMSPRVNADGTITFTVTSFSTFVFANENTDSAEHYHSYYDMTVAPTATTWGYTSHTCECGDVYYDNYVAPLNESVAAATSPQTGESAVPMVAAVAAVMLIGGVVVFRKREVLAK